MSLQQRFICIHGHFYQPPRENPWTGLLDPQPTAAPFHDWNERIAAECYTPNAVARILDAHGNILLRQNNYAQISFNFGPTLLSWLKLYAPETYGAILAADSLSRGAMAQAYNHMILPLANAGDRATQVIWGSRDFQYRFGRAPEGMWLPETAVNLASLDELAAAGIRFTVLAPHQAHRVRAFGSNQWTDVGGGRIDTRRVYEVRLPSERSIAVFFYDAGFARDVAFGGALNDGEALAARLRQAFRDEREAQLVSFATDGESYGHHHRFGEMALAAALYDLAAHPEVVVTNYRAFLATHPPAHEVELFENTSWSCAHGVERWRSDCGCHVDGPAGWRQAWRQPLRAALDWLRDQLAAACQQATQDLLWEFWEARNDYIEVVLDPSDRVRAGFLERHVRRPLDPGQRELVWNVLEIQRNAMLMYTSCGWFFDDISGLEAAQIIAYAARAAQLAEQTLGAHLELELLKLLEAAPSNDPAIGNGRVVYERQRQKATAASPPA